MPEEILNRRSSNYDLALWYSSKAKFYLREGEKLFQEFRYPECVSSFGASIEFALKAICAFLGVDYKWEHDVSRPLIRLSSVYPKLKENFSRAALISSRWVGANQQNRNLVNYGNQDAGLPATKMIGRKDVELIKTDAFEVCKLLHFVEIKQKFGFPRKLGILNGFVDESDPSEKPCVKYPFTEFKINDWEKRFSQFFDVTEGRYKYQIEKISISRVKNEFSVIINPFGEAYPEKDVKKRFAFNILKNYVEDGGILVNVAGFPFFYAWNVIKGSMEPVVDEKVLIPKSIKVKEEKFLINRFYILLNFAGSLLWRELGAITTSDTPEFSGINQLEVYQNEEDKKIVGDIINLGGENKVYEFRALRGETKGLIPFLRTHRPDFGEVYPIAAVQIGFGYLIVGGMNTKSASEFEKIVVVVDNFCDWLLKNG
jgi:HEPN domain-containing protein